MADDIILTPEELVQVTGGYRQPFRQLQELHRLGFYRARRSKVTGEVILERAHYEAVCSGREPDSKPRPQVRPVVKPRGG